MLLSSQGDVETVVEESFRGNTARFERTDHPTGVWIRSTLGEIQAKTLLAAYADKVIEDDTMAS